MPSAPRTERTHPPRAWLGSSSPPSPDSSWKELEYLGAALTNPKRPFVAILGGSKISGKIDVIEALLPKVDALLIGGAMACTFFKAMGLETGKSLVEADRVDMAKELLARAGTRLIAAARRHRGAERGRRRQGTRREARRDSRRRSDARHRPRYRRRRTHARSPAPRRWCGTDRWACSRRRRSTPARAPCRRAMADATANGATTIVGGGDSAAAVEEQGSPRA